MRTFPLVCLLCLFINIEIKFLFHSLRLLFPTTKMRILSRLLIPRHSTHSYLIKQLLELCSASVVDALLQSRLYKSVNTKTYFSMGKKKKKNIKKTEICFNHSLSLSYLDCYTRVIHISCTFSISQYVLKNNLYSLHP